MTDIETVRKELQNMRLYVMAYTHPDWSWCHTRQWHEHRYIAAFEDILSLCAEEQTAAWYIDCYVTQLQPVEERAPELLEHIARAVAEGRIAVCGAYANVRPNMMADEAYIRNLTLGRQKFTELFPGVDLSVHADSVDVALGHPQLPQILTKAGYRYFRVGRPYDVLRKKGLPHGFRWCGLDGSEILAWWACYDGFCHGEAVRLINGKEDWEQTVCALYDREIARFTKASPTDIAWLPFGCDDGLPFKAFNTDDLIDIFGFIEKWNARETSRMQIATPPAFFAQLDKQRDCVPVVKGTIDPCDVCYNAAWGGEKGLAPLRLKSAERLAESEIWMAAAAMSVSASATDTRALWQNCLTACAHASQWVFEEDREELFAFAQQSMDIATALRDRAINAVVRRLMLPSNTAVTVFNSHDKDRFVTVEITVPCGDADALRLCDGFGDSLDFQVIQPYEYAGMAWEHRLLVRLKLPANGVNVIAVSNGDISCRAGGKYTRPKKPVARPCEGKFTVTNGTLTLSFTDGDLRTVSDDQGTTVLPLDKVSWNAVDFVGVNSDEGDLHAGPETERRSVRWQTYTVTEEGPVRWKVCLTGTDGVLCVTQQIELEKDSCTLGFETTVDNWPICSGYLAARIPVEDGARLYGGIPFGTEKKDMDNEPFNGREEGWSDFHRQWDGLFFAKDFAAAEGDTLTAALCHLSGDRYYIYEKNNRSLSCMLIHCAYPYKDTCEEYMNTAMFQSPGTHSFRYAVLVEPKNTPKYMVASAAAALRREPILCRPYRNREGVYTIPACGSFVHIDAENVNLSALYVDGEDVVVRLWEAGGVQTSVALTLPVAVTTVRAENFIGQTDSMATTEVRDGKAFFQIKPYEIVTLRVTPRHETH